MTSRTRRVRKGMIATVAAVLVTASIVQPVGADPTIPGAGAPATMEANGRYFPRDAQGRALNMHGFNIKLHADRIGEVSLEQLQGMKRNGFDLLRLAIFWADMEPTQGAWNDQYFADLAHVLDLAETAGVKVVLDMHQDSYSPEVGGFGMPDWTTRTDGLTYSDPPIPCLDAANQRAWNHFYDDQDLRDAQVAAWLQVVDRLGDKPAVYGYDLLNEPCGQMNAGEGINEALQRVEATQITPMLQRVTDAIRTKDTTHWIFLEGAFALTSTFAAPGGLGPVHDPTGRQIFAPHLYDLGMESGGDWDPSSDFITRYYDNIVSYGATNHVPTIVFEWGPQKPASPNAADFVSQILHGADAATAGWAAFAWCEALGGWCQLDSDGNPGAGMTDTVQTYPTAIAGRPLSISGDYAAGVSKVTVDPANSGASGPTEFYFPLRRFPSGPSVSVDLPGSDWSSTWDATTQTLAVTVNSQATHTITVYPMGTTPPEETTTTTTTSTTTPATTLPATSTSTAPGGSSTSIGAPRPGASASTPTPVTAFASGELPKTGIATGPLVAIGAALIAMGLVLDTLRRRRRAEI